jgi:hypothetical protein
MAGVLSKIIAEVNIQIPELCKLYFEQTAEDLQYYL